ncbi:MAG: hypothetical protein ACI4AK_07955 [Lepagella sp.]
MSFVYPSIFISDTTSEESGDGDKSKNSENGETSEVSANVEDGKTQEESKTPSRFDLVKDSVSKITEDNFINTIFKGTPLPRIKEPYILIKIGKSRVESNSSGKRPNSTDDFVCIPIEEGPFARFVDELTDDILVRAHDVNASCTIYVDKPLVIRGFAKTLMDFAIYQASEAITKITIDLVTCKMRSVSNIWLKSKICNADFIVSNEIFPTTVNNKNPALTII